MKPRKRKSRDGKKTRHSFRENWSFIFQPEAEQRGQKNIQTEHTILNIIERYELFAEISIDFPRPKRMCLSLKYGRFLAGTSERNFIQFHVIQKFHARTNKNAILFRQNRDKVSRFWGLDATGISPQKHTRRRKRNVKFI